MFFFMGNSAVLEVISNTDTGDPCLRDGRQALIYLSRDQIRFEKNAKI